MRQVADDYRAAGLPEKQVRMLAFVERLAATPPASSREAVAALREAGWSDAAVLDIVQVVAYFAFVNRIAEGLGVELEPYWPEAVRRPDGG